MIEREPSHIITDLSKKAADDASDAIRRTACLVDHAEDRIAIMVFASISTCGGALGAFSLLPENSDMDPDEIVDGLLLMMRPGMVRAMQVKTAMDQQGG